MKIIESKPLKPWLSIPADLISSVLYVFFFLRISEYFQSLIYPEISYKGNWPVIVISFVIAFLLRLLAINHIQIRAKNSVLSKGLRRPFKKKLLQSESINPDDLKSLFISQNEDKFFELIAEREDGYRMQVYKMPNRKPLERKFQKLLEKDLKGWPMPEMKI